MDVVAVYVRARDLGALVEGTDALAEPVRRHRKRVHVEHGQELRVDPGDREVERDAMPDVHRKPKNAQVVPLTKVIDRPVG